MEQQIQFGSLGVVCRLGLATRGGSELAAADVQRAMDRGVNYFNWCGHVDGLSRAVRQLGSRRDSIVLAVQMEARSAAEATGELDSMLAQLGTDYVDIVTYYYVQHRSEWQTIMGPNGAHEAMLRARDAGKVRLLGITSHQRRLAAEIARSGAIDMLMVRYNAAHRGAERDIFPVTDRLRMPVVTFTGMRWGALVRSTPEDPPGFMVPSPAECYVFALGCPSVSVALMAPNDGVELERNLEIVDNWQPLSPARHAAIAGHGQRVRRHAGSFP